MLAALSDQDLEKLQEQASLRETGFYEERIWDMMAHMWSLFSRWWLDSRR